MDEYHILSGQCCPSGIVAQTGSELTQATDADLNKGQRIWQN